MFLGRCSVLGCREMGLIEVVLILVLIGVVIGGLQRIPWLDPAFVPVIRVVVLIAVILWLWRAFGAPDIPLGR